MKHLRHQYDELLQHNESLGDEFLRLRMILDGFRNNVGYGIRSEVLRLKACVSSFRNVFQYHTMHVEKDFSALNYYVKKLAESRPSVAQILALEKDKEKREKERTMSGGYAAHHSHSPRSNARFSLDEENESLCRQLDDLRSEKVILEEQLQLASDAHERHMKQVKALHKERETTLLAQLNMLSDVVDHRDRETAAAIDLTMNFASRQTANDSQRRYASPTNKTKDVTDVEPVHRDTSPGGAEHKTSTALWADRVLKDRLHVNKNTQQDRSYGSAHISKRAETRRLKELEAKHGGPPRVASATTASRGAASASRLRSPEVRRLNFNRDRD